MEDIASNIIENEEDDDKYIIILNDGAKIKPDEIVLRSSVELDTFGKLVSRDSAWESLLNYYTMNFSINVSVVYY